MSTIGSVSPTADTVAKNSTATSNSTSINTADQKDVSSADFMKLLIAQLQNQDPTSPVDNQAFVTQLATFNSLEQLVDINSNVAKLLDRTDTNNSLF